MRLSVEAVHQTLAIFPVSFNEFTMGMGNGWLAPTLKKLQDASSEIPLNTEQCSWIGSLHEFGRFFGPVISALLLDKIGRKRLLVLCAVMFFLMWLILLLTRSVALIYIVRFIFGIGIGICDVTSSIYLAENCSPKYRGIFSSITIIFFYVGMLMEFILSAHLSYKSVIIINLILSFLGLVSTYFLEETPHFFIIREKFEDAGITLKWLKGTPLWNDVQDEFQTIKNNVAEEKSKKSIQQLLSAPANYKSLIIGFMLNMLAMSTGYAAIVAFSSLIFVPSASLTSNAFTIIYGINQLIAVCISVFVIERFNRRNLVLISFSAFAIIHTVIAALYYYSDGISSSQFYPWLVFLSVSIYGSIFTFVYPVIYIIRGELFPQSVKAIGNCIAVMAHSATSFISAKMFLVIAFHYGLYVNFLLFSIISILAFVYTYFFLPETRGKTLIDIQKLFEK